MVEKGTTSAPILRIERRFAAPPERVFDAWVQAETLSRWFAPSDEYVSEVTTLEPRAGGRYRIVMQHQGGAAHAVGGVYHTVERPNRLVFSFQWEDDTAPGDMRVSVEFRRDGAGTRMVLVQDRFVSADAVEGHEKGWNGSLARLTRLVEHEAR